MEKNQEKWHRFHVEAGKTCGFIPGIPCQTLNMTKSIRIPSLNVPEMRPLGTFQSILSNGYHGNDDR